MDEPIQAPQVPAPAPESTNSLSVPVSIVVAGALIAAAIYFVGGAPATLPNGEKAVEVEKVTSADHIIGNPNAEVFVVEYSDLDCPFCKQFHTTMKQIMADYGASGKVAWVYRHFPLAQLHPNAPKLAEASECVTEQGGNAAFWKFVDVLFEKAPVNQKTDMAKINDYAALAGVNATTFAECLSSGKYADLVQTQFDDAVASGGQGTPHNIIVSKDGKTVPIAGAQPYATVKSVIETMLAE